MSGTTSHTVASATRSSRPSRSGSAPVAIEALAAERARGGDEEQEHDAGRGQMALTGEIVLPVRIEDGERGRQLLVGLVMIDDDHLGAALLAASIAAPAVVPQSTVMIRRRALLGEPAQRSLASGRSLR